jgi:hypothetical protein
VATVIGLAVIAVLLHTGRPAARSLPATPQGWVEQWTAAAIEDPARVCGELFAPALAAAYLTDYRESCMKYFSQVDSKSFRVRHVLQDGGTATIEAHEVGAGRRWGFVTFVLSRVRGGWRAVDIVPGGTVRPR